MRYLETHNDYFILESMKGTTRLDEVEFNDLIAKNCTEFSDTDRMIYRGIEELNTKSDYFEIDPKQRIRKSARTRNYYTLIMSHSDVWKDYPPRDKSMICTQNKEVANMYGHTNVFRVIPYDGSRWGVSNVWLKIAFKTDNMMFFNEDLDKYIFNFCGVNLEKYENDYGKFINTLREVSDCFLKNYKGSTIEKYNLLNVVIEYMKEHNKTLDVALVDLLSPNENFKLMDYKELVSNDLSIISKCTCPEIWTDSTCLLKRIK